MRVILVEPKYDSNVGKICRVLKNFGYNDLWIVNPRCKLGFEAEVYAKHAKDILKTAKTVKNFDEAIKDRYPIIGTTASLIKGKRDLIKNTPLQKLKEKIPILHNSALVFGSEDNGLSREDLAKCDIISYIETSSEYESLNLSNAVAIYLYELRNSLRVKETQEYEKKNEAIKKLKELVKELTYSMKGIRKPEKCIRATINVINRAKMEDKEEINSIICIFRNAIKNLKRINNLKKEEI